MAAVSRTDLVTQDMDLMADLIRSLYVGHSGTFRCLDPNGVDARLHSVSVGGLTAGLARYGGFEYAAEVSPVGQPTVVYVTHGSGAVDTAREQLRCLPGDVYMAPADLPCKARVNAATHVSLHVPWRLVGALAEEQTGIPSAAVRFTGMRPVSAARQRRMAETIAFAFGELVASGAVMVYRLVVQEMARLAAAVMLETFPNTTMTAGYLPGPGWAAPASVRRAAEFIHAHAGEPATVTEIAAAAGVTARALHYAFRRHYDITPAQYQRLVRLERAHRELRQAGPGDGLTVTEVARKWGWASPARFTAAYQQRFSVPPGHTLRPRSAENN
jgi:AraC-like DNA-binding protein